MKKLATILLVGTVLAATAEAQVRLVRHGKDVTEPPSTLLSTNIISLLQSCSVDSSAYAVKPETWQSLLNSDSFVHVTFSAPRKLTIEAADNQGLVERVISEILVPLPEGAWPAHIFARSGTNILSFTKFDSRALKSIVFEPALQLSSVQPYAMVFKFEGPAAGRHLAEAQAIALAAPSLPLPAGEHYRANFRNGIWEVFTDREGANFRSWTVVTIRDSDGKVLGTQIRL